MHRLVLFIARVLTPSVSKSLHFHVYEVKHEEKWFWDSNMEISKTSQNFILE
jgi:hypothetical protein